MFFTLEVKDMNDEAVKAMFIYRAINAGWTVSKNGVNEYKFTKQHGGALEEFFAPSFLHSFVLACMPHFHL
jgi:hypothetical protein